MTDTPPTRAEVPGTRRESPGTRRESVGTRRESVGTRVEGVAAEPGSRYRRIRLPEPLEERYEHLYDLADAGAQADIAICRDREAGTEVAVKLYRVSADRVDADAIDQLRHADPDHVVPILDFRTWGGWTWEVQEFFPLGSLSALLQDLGGPVPPELARALLDELAGALTHIHERDIVHRDLKPQNVLLRSLEPLDCVIADFGLATTIELSADIRSVAGTFPYQPPEGHFGVLTKTADWWALGMIVYEALQGRHLLTDPATGAMLPENHIRAIVGQGTYTVDSVGDERWDLLIRGLLVHDHEHRWDARQVNAWQAGETPEVYAGPAATRRTVQPFTLAGRSLVDTAALAEALRSDWQAAGELMVGRGAEDLMLWLRQTEVGRGADHVLSGGIQPDPAVVRLQAILDPARPPAFRGRTLDQESLDQVIAAARAGDEEAARWIGVLRRGRVLSAWAGEAPVTEHVRLADDLLRGWWRRVDQLLEQAPEDVRPQLAPVRTSLEGVLLLASLDPGQVDRIRADGRREAKSAGSSVPAWAREIVQGAGKGSDDVAASALAAVVLPVVTDLEKRRREAEQHAARDRARAQARARRSAHARDAWQRGRGSFLAWVVPLTLGGVVAGLSIVGPEPGEIVPWALAGLACAAAVAAWHLLLPAPRSRLGRALPWVAIPWSLLDVVGSFDPEELRTNAGAWTPLALVVVAAAWGGRALGLLADRQRGSRPAEPSPPKIRTAGLVGLGAGTLAVLGLAYGQVHDTFEAPSVGRAFTDMPDWYAQGAGTVIDAVAPVAHLVAPVHGVLALAAVVLGALLLFAEQDLAAPERRIANVVALGVLASGLLAAVGDLAAIAVVLFGVGALAVAVGIVVAMAMLGFAMVAG